MEDFVWSLICKFNKNVSPPKKDEINSVNFNKVTMCLQKTLIKKLPSYRFFTLVFYECFEPSETLNLRHNLSTLIKDMYSCYFKFENDKRANTWWQSFPSEVNSLQFTNLPFDPSNQCLKEWREKKRKLINTISPFPSATVIMKTKVRGNEGFASSNLTMKAATWISL